MKKLLLILALIVISNKGFCQYPMFMHMLESRMICDKYKVKEYLTNNAYLKNGNVFNKFLSDPTRDYKASFITTDDCYIVYKTNSLTEYLSIKRAVNNISTNGNRCYIRKDGNIEDVTVTFLGFNNATGEGEIKVYQAPERHRYLVNRR